MKKKVLLISVLLLTACTNTPLSSSLGSSSESSLSNESSSSNPYATPGVGITNTNLALTNTDDYLEAFPLPSLGEQKILVVPCQFEGEREFTPEMIDNVKKAFFGANISEIEGANNYYSLSEYYYKSSLGKLILTGEVLDIIKVPYTISQLELEGAYLPGVPAMSLLQTADKELLQEYDQNKDGFLDSVCFIYSSPTSERSGSFWAWVTGFSTVANLETPQPNKHMWCGIDFFDDDFYEVNAHTIIHETGHLLGLRDYYPTDNYENALGGHSMMDFNISDHDPYSKMLLGWADPTYYEVPAESEITVRLQPFQGTNQFILLNNDWNHSVMDEYILIEYYTPDGLNELDAKHKYQTRPIGFTKPGIKLYHADSRVAKCVLNQSQNGLNFETYVEEIPNTKEEGVYYVIGASNSYADSRTDASRQGRYKQIAMIENKKYNLLQNGESADDDSLFYEGDIFTSNNSPYLINGKYNTKKDVDLIIEVVELTSDYATLKIRSIGGTL